MNIEQSLECFWAWDTCMSEPRTKALIDFDYEEHCDGWEWFINSVHYKKGVSYKGRNMP
jgi:hypothetical protein